MLPPRAYGTTTRNHYISGPPPRGPLAHPVRTGALGGAGGDVVVTVGVRLAVLGSVGIKIGPLVVQGGVEAWVEVVGGQRR